MLGVVAAASEVLAAGDPGRGGRGRMLQRRRGEASQAQDCFAGRREVLTARLRVGSKVMCHAGGEKEKRGLRRGSRQGRV